MSSWMVTDIDRECLLVRMHIHTWLNVNSSLLAAHILYISKLIHPRHALGCMLWIGDCNFLLTLTYIDKKVTVV